MINSHNEGSKMLIRNNTYAHETPIEIHIYILLYLLPEQIGLLLLVSKEFGMIANEKFNPLWNIKRDQHFPHKKFNNIKGNFYQQFKTIYKKENYSPLHSIINESASDSLENIEVESNAFERIFLTNHITTGASLLDLAQKKKDQRVLNYIYNQGKKCFAKQRNGLIHKNSLDTQIKINNQSISILRLAIECFQPLKEIKELIEIKGSKIDETYTFNKFPLYLASRFGLLEVVQYFLKVLPDSLNQRDISNQTPLISACGNGRDNVLEYFLSLQDIDLTACTDATNFTDKKRRGWNALHWAAYNGSVKCIQLLLDYNELNLCFTQEQIDNAFFITAEYKNFDANKTLLERFPALIHQKNNIFGKSILMYACEAGDKEYVNYLLQNDKINLTEKCNEKNTALDWAVRKGHDAVIRLIIEKVKIEQLDENHNILSMLIYAYILAARRGRLQNLKTFLEYYPELLNQSDHEDKTALIVASANGRVDIVKYLLSLPEINITVSICINSKHHLGNGYDALHCAAKNAFGEIVDLLLQHPAIKISRLLMREINSIINPIIRVKIELLEYKNGICTDTLFGLFGETAEEKKVTAQKLFDLVYFKGTKQEYKEAFQAFQNEYSNDIFSRKRLKGTLLGLYTKFELYLQRKINYLPENYNKQLLTTQENVPK